MRAATVSAAEAAHLLMLGLGPMRAWADFLSDNIRGRQDINGKTLLPCCELHDGRKYRPRYAIEEIRRFIMQVRELFPEKCVMRGIELDINPRLDWRVQHFDKYGSLVTT